jgi:hypothetical protein
MSKTTGSLSRTMMAMQCIAIRQPIIGQILCLEVLIGQIILISYKVKLSSKKIRDIRNTY